MESEERRLWLASRDNGGSLRKFLQGRERYLHVSARAGMNPDPRGKHFPMIPWVEKPGSTYRRAA